MLPHRTSSTANTPDPDVSSRLRTTSSIGRTLRGRLDLSGRAALCGRALRAHRRKFTLSLDGSALESVLLEPAIQLGARDPQLPGGPHLVATDFAQGLFNGLALEDPQIRAAQRWHRLPDGQREVLGVDKRLFAHDPRPLEHVAQLADIARPIVPAQRLHCRGRQFRGGATKLAK